MLSMSFLSVLRFLAAGFSKKKFYWLPLLLAVGAPLHGDSITYTLQSSPGRLTVPGPQYVYVNDWPDTSTVFAEVLDPPESGESDPIAYSLFYFGNLVPRGAIVHAAHLSVSSFQQDVRLSGVSFLGGGPPIGSCTPIAADSGCQPALVEPFVDEYINLKFYETFPAYSQFIYLAPGGEYNLFDLFGPSALSQGFFEADGYAFWTNHVSIIDPGYNAFTRVEYDAPNPEVVDLTLKIAYSVPEPPSLLLFGIVLLYLVGLVRGRV